MISDRLLQSNCQYQYNTLVLNGISFGIVASVVTIILVPWGYGKFSGPAFLILLQLTAIIASLSTLKNEHEGGHWMSYFFVTVFLLIMSVIITSILSVELLNMGHSYGEVRKTIRGSETELIGMNLGILVTMSFGLLGAFLSRGIRRKNTYVDYFLLDPTLATFLWQR